MGTEAADIARLQSLAAHIQRKRIVAEGFHDSRRGDAAWQQSTQLGSAQTDFAVVGRALPLPADVAAAQQRARRRHRKQLARIVADQWLWVARDRLAALPRRAVLRHRKLRACFQARDRQLCPGASALGGSRAFVLE